MEEIDLKELFDFIKGKIFTLFTLTLLVCLIGCVYGLFLQKPMYKSYTTVILGGNETNNNSNSSGITQSDITLNKNLVDTYAEIVKSRRVLVKVINELRLNMSYEKLHNMITVGALNNTEIIKISVSDIDPIRAKNIANVTANYFTEEVKALYNMNNVNILDEAIETNKPYNINVIKQVLIYFIIGFVLSAGVLFVIFYFDRTIKSAEQIEQKLKLPILGSVQEYTKGGKK